MYAFIQSPFSVRGQRSRFALSKCRRFPSGRGSGKSPQVFATIAPVPEVAMAELWSSEQKKLLFYNTLTRKKEPFVTIDPGLVRFYSCGPTVYDYAHIGNFRAFLTYDVIKRWLLFRGYEVNHVMNLTDVDDKIIKKVQQLGCTATELTNKFADAFFADLDLLNVIRAQHYPRATEHISDIEDVINGLKSRNVAYERDGSTYFSVSSFPEYGRLAELDKRQSGSRTTAASNQANDSDEYGKDDLRDFALWKSYKPEDGDVFWNNSLGKGRPGWHIECSAMAMKYLGPKLDIHAGGVDLVFPHHENEIAQSEALTGQRFSTFWLHNGFVNIDNEKMSKSLGNFRTLRDIVKKPDDARAFRYLVVSSQYRSALAFTEQSIKSARSTVKRLDSLRRKLDDVLETRQEEDAQSDANLSSLVQQSISDFCNAMDDDLNTPRAAAAMFKIVNASEKLLKAGTMKREDANLVLNALLTIDKVFGVFYAPDLGNENESSEAEKAEEEIPAELLALLEERTAARKSKNFARADEIRDAVAKAGFSIVDTPQGPKLVGSEIN